MFRLVYISTATREFTNDDLEELLEKSRLNNSKVNITGLLIVKGRTFIQCLEGDEKDVLYIYDKIKADDRHKDLIELIEEDCDERYFPNWDMGYKNIKNLTNIESDKIKDLDIESFNSKSNDEISELFKRFVKDY